MKTTKRSNHVRTIGGGERVAIRLAQGIDAVMDAADFDDLMARGFTDQFFLNDNGFGRSYVRLHGTTNTLSVARLILCAEPGAKVCHIDVNRLNLIRANLELRLRRGGRTKPTPATVADYFPAQPETVEHLLKGRSPLGRTHQPAARRPA